MSLAASLSAHCDRAPRRVALALALLGMLPFARTVGFDFVGLDDPKVVLQNPYLASPFTLDFWRWAVTGAYYGNWFPLTWASHALDVELFGFWAGGHHAVNVVLHGVCTALVFAFLREATGAPGRAAVVAALFAVHPLHVESVAWVTERKDVLSSAFGFGSLWIWTRYVKGEAGRRSGAYLGTCLAFAAALASKPMWVTLPCVLLLLDVWPFRRLSWPLPEGSVRVIAEKLPLFGVSVVASFITIAAQGESGAMAQGAQLSPGERLANGLVSLAAYLRRVLLPIDLAPFYPHPYLAAEGGVPPSTLALAAAGLLVFALGVAVLRDRRGPLAVGLLWFAGMLVPVLGIAVQVGGQGMADRYVYAPIAGALIALVWTIAPQDRDDVSTPWLGAVAAATVALTISCALQTELWRNSRTLYEGGLAVQPRAQTLRFGLAQLERGEGRPEAAIAAYRAALEIDPRSSRAHNGIGLTLLQQGELDRARIHLERALELQPDLSFALHHLGTLHRRQGEPALAEVRLREALSVRPDYVAALVGLGELLVERGRAGEAIPLFERAVGHRPDSASAWEGWVDALLGLGEAREARSVLDRARSALGDRPRLGKLRRRLDAMGS